MGLRPTHLGYAYQDLLTALRLVDLVVGRTTSVLVDTKLFTRDRFDDITCEWGTSNRERLQIKHTDHDRALSLESFTKDSRGLRLDLLFSSMEHDLTSHPGASHRLAVRDTEPEDPELTRVLRPVHTNADPGPALHGLNSKRFRFDAAALRAHAPWKEMLAEVNDDLLSRACASWSSTRIFRHARSTSASPDQLKRPCCTASPKNSVPDGRRTGTARPRKWHWP